MESTRQQILLYLEDHPHSSAPEIAHYLEMTPANIRYHLDILEERGWVQRAGTRPPGGAGRPIQLYNLTAAALGNNLPTLLRAILEWIDLAEDPRQVFQQIAGRLIPEHPATLSRVQRYNQAVASLNTHLYHASWEARPEGPRVSLRHCPYGNLAVTNPLICLLDEELISSLFDSEMRLVEKRTFGKNPFSPCVFHSSRSQEEKGD